MNAHFFFDTGTDDIIGLTQAAVLVDPEGDTQAVRLLQVAQVLDVLALQGVVHYLGGGSHAAHELLAQAAPALAPLEALAQRAPDGGVGKLDAGVGAGDGTGVGVGGLGGAVGPGLGAWGGEPSTPKAEDREADDIAATRWKRGSH